MNSLDVAKVRALTGKSQSEFAKLLGVTRGAVTLWETKDLDKRTKPKLSIVLKIREIEQGIHRNNNLSESTLTGTPIVEGFSKTKKEFSDLKIDEKLDALDEKLRKIQLMLQTSLDAGADTKKKVENNEKLIAQTNRNMFEQTMSIQELIDDIDQKTKSIRKLS